VLARILGFQEAACKHEGPISRCLVDFSLHLSQLHKLRSRWLLYSVVHIRLPDHSKIINLPQQVFLLASRIFLAGSSAAVLLVPKRHA